jgi:trehalose 2-sulfotransferase
MVVVNEHSSRRATSRARLTAGHWAAKACVMPWLVKLSSSRSSGKGRISMNTVRHKPRRRYWICFTPRTGSALLCQLLRATGVAGRPEEYFWRDNEPVYRARWHVASYHDYLERALEEGTTPNGIFGAKVGAGVHLAHFFCQLRTLPQFEDMTPSRGSILAAPFPDLKCIWLTRRNKVRQAVSWWKAVQSNSWIQHTTDTRRPTPPLTYRFAAIDQVANEILMQEAAWAECFAAWQITPLSIVYEDFIDDWARTVAYILRYLEIGDPYVLDETAITLVGQADSLSEAWVQQYREEKQQHWPNRAW